MPRVVRFMHDEAGRVLSRLLAAVEYRDDFTREDVAARCLKLVRAHVAAEIRKATEKGMSPLAEKYRIMREDALFSIVMCSWDNRLLFEKESP